MTKLDDYDQIDRQGWESLIDRWIFDQRNREILKRRLLDGVRFEPLAEEFSLSVQQTKTIVKRGLDRLIRHI